MSVPSHERQVNLGDFELKKISSASNNLRWCLIMTVVFAVVVTIGFFIALYSLGAIAAIGQ